MLEPQWKPLVVHDLNSGHSEAFLRRLAQARHASGSGDIKEDDMMDIDSKGMEFDSDRREVGGDMVMTAAQYLEMLAPRNN